VAKGGQLLLAKADVGAVSRQLELALIYDGKLDVRAHRISRIASICGAVPARTSSSTLSV